MLRNKCLYAIEWPVQPVVGRREGGERRKLLFRQVQDANTDCRDISVADDWDHMSGKLFAQAGGGCSIARASASVFTSRATSRRTSLHARGQCDEHVTRHRVSRRSRTHNCSSSTALHGTKRKAEVQRPQMRSLAESRTDSAIGQGSTTGIQTTHAVRNRTTRSRRGRFLPTRYSRSSVSLRAQRVNRARKSCQVSLLRLPYVDFEIATGIKAKRFVSVLLGCLVCTLTKRSATVSVSSDSCRKLGSSDVNVGRTEAP
jgi:hypothetical protein